MLEGVEAVAAAAPLGPAVAPTAPSRPVEAAALRRCLLSLLAARAHVGYTAPLCRATGNAGGRDRFVPSGRVIRVQVHAAQSREETASLGDEGPARAREDLGGALGASGSDAGACHSVKTLEVLAASGARDDAALMPQAPPPGLRPQRGTAGVAGDTMGRRGSALAVE